MIDWPLVSVIIFLPLIGSLIILFIKEDELTSINIKWAALLTTLGTFILSLILWLQFNYSNPSYQYEEKFRWFDDFNFFYHVGVDGISLFMILLSTFLTPFCILASWENIKKRIKQTNAVLGGEMSGHIFINHDWYGFDDAIFSAVILTKIISDLDISVSEKMEEIPSTYSTSELNLHVKDEDKFTIVEIWFYKPTSINGKN